MLKELQQLLQSHQHIPLNRNDFQPDETTQRRLIITGATHRLISLAFKRETTKYIYSQKQKLEDILKQNLQVETNNQNLGNKSSLQSSGNQGYRIHSKVPKKRHPKSSLKKRGSSSVFQDTVGISSRMLEFAKILKESTDANRIRNELHHLSVEQTKDSKHIFDLICRGYDLGKVYQLNPKKINEEIDLREYGSVINIGTVTKLEDLNQMKRKDGILLLFDPSTNTLNEEISIRITYMRAIDLNTEEEVKKEYILWSNGNYFGITLQRELVRGSSPTTSNASSHDFNSQLLLDRPRISLPGWQGRNPIFIPATNCRLEILGLENYSKNAFLMNSLTRLRFYAAFSAGVKAGVRRITDFLETYLLQEMANSVLPGGMSALNYACLNGNVEAVRMLVASGASIHNRCKGDHHCTPLHEAVFGRNVEIVSFLLSQGANQLLKDDSGNCPLHYACKVGDMALVRILMESAGGRRALVSLNNLEQKPIDVCATNYVRIRVEGVMRKHRIFVAPRISILDRT